MHEQHKPNNEPNSDDNQTLNTSFGTGQGSRQRRETKWFQENTAPLQSLEPTDKLNKNEKEIIASIIKDKTIVGFGEACHWHSREAQQVKDRLFRHLVEEHGFRIFAMEDSREACKQVNKPLNDPQSSDSAEEITKKFGFGVWRTREMGSLIGYIKEWNHQNQADPISVIGVDAHNPFVPLQKIKSGNLIPKGSQFEKALERLEEAIITLDGQVYRAAQAGKFGRTSRSDDVKLALDSLEKIKSGNLSPNDSDFKEALEELEIAINILSNQANGKWSEGGAYRDEQMYKSLKKFHQDHKEKRIFLWAHNGHIYKHPEEPVLGKRINEDSELKEHYAAIGFCHNFEWQDKKEQEQGLPSDSFEAKTKELSSNNNTIINLNESIPFADKEGKVNIAIYIPREPKADDSSWRHERQELRECFDGMIYLKEANLSSPY